MKLIRYVILCLSGLLIQQSVNAQVKLMSSITTNSPDDTYPTHMDSLGKGGFMAVPTKAIRDKLSTQRRKVGMMVYVSETDSVYQLKGDTTNAHWVSFKLASAMGWQGTQTSHPANPQLNWAYYNSSDRKSYIYDGNNWQMFAQDGAGGSTTFNGSRPITLGLSPFKNQNPNTNDLAAWIEKVFYPSESPEAEITGMSFVNPGTGSTVNVSSSVTIENMASGADIPVTINWKATRLASTATLDRITVGGLDQTFAQPDPNTFVNGSAVINISRNINRTFRNDVVTTDGKDASASISISFGWQRYFGFMTAPGGVAEESAFEPSMSDIRALSNKSFATSKVIGSTTVTSSGNQRLVIAFPLAYDPGPGLLKIWIGGIESSGAFVRYPIIDFENASGGKRDYVVYVHKYNLSDQVTLNVD